MGITLTFSVEYLVFKFHTMMRIIIFHFPQLSLNIYKSKTLLLIGITAFETEVFHIQQGEKSSMYLA